MSDGGEQTSGGNGDQSGAAEPVMLAKYQIIEAVRSDPMAELLLARDSTDPDPGRFVLVRKVDPRLTARADFLTLFNSESEHRSELRHPNIVRSEPAQEVDGVWFVASEYCRGANLRDVLDELHKRGHRLPLDQALYVVTCACAALQHAHEHVDSKGRPSPVLHRDIAPRNLIITPQGHVKVTGFGLAQLRDRFPEIRPARSPAYLGYKSPEGVRGEPVDERSDLFVLSIVLYELTLDRRLFAGTRPFEVFKQIAESNVPLPRSIDPEYPAELEQIVMRGLAKLPADRYAHVGDLLTALQGLGRRLKLDMSSVACARYLHDVLGASVVGEDPAAAADSGGIDDADLLGESTGTPEFVVPTLSHEAVMAGAKQDDQVEWDVLAADAATKPSRRAPAPVEHPQVEPDPEPPIEIAEDISDELSDDIEEADEPQAAPETRPRAAAAPRRAAVAHEAPPVAEVSEKRRRGAGIWIVLGLLVAGAAAAAVMLRPGQEAKPEPAPTPTALPAKAPPAAANVPAAPTFGSLRVTTAPAGAAILVDGKPTDKVSPASIDKLEVGSQVVLVARLEGHKEARRDVRITGDKELAVDLALEPAAPVAPPTEAAPAPAADPKTAAPAQPTGRAARKAARRARRAARRSRAESSPEPAVTGTGRLLLAAEPWADVVIDGKSQGPTPLSVELSAGTHTVVLTSKQLRQTRTLRIQVKPGQKVKKRVVFE